MALASEQNFKTQGGQSFVRARARLQRLSDKKFFAGYIESINHIGISIRLNASELKVACGDQFNIEVTGHRSAAALSVEVIATEGSVIHQVLLRPVTFHAKKQDVRLLMFGEPCRITFDGVGHPAMSIDIAENGLGVLSHAFLETGSLIDFELGSPVGPVHGKGEVRYCQPDLAVTNQFRAGIRIISLDETSKERWVRLMNSALTTRPE